MDVLGFAVGAIGLAAHPLSGQAQSANPAADSGVPFGPSSVLDLARILAKSPAKPNTADLPDPFTNLNYEQYVGIRPKRSGMIWGDENTGFVIEPLHRGFVFSAPTQMNVVESGLSRRLAYKVSDFEFGALQPSPNTPDIGFSGFRVLHQRDGRLAEIAIFQGASYFRAQAPGQSLGVTARGLAIRTADSRGEEFPVFKAIWIEKPSRANNALIIHALLESESLTGAYRFTVRAGEATIIDTELTLVPRVAIDHLGIAAMSATSISSPLDRRRPDDVRPMIAEVNGLQMLTGKDEWIWRPVTNRATLQVSSFVDSNPKGFGFLLRNRDFDAYQDDDLHWELRPSLWIEPIGEFGAGTVQLVEIPAESETNSNCIAYWRPASALKAGEETAWAYRQFWCWNPPTSPNLATVIMARNGKGPGTRRRRFVVVFSGDLLGDTQNIPEIKPALSISPGTIGSLRAFVSRERKTCRVVFDIDPGSETTIEMRLVLEAAGKPISETWLYRWTT